MAESTPATITDQMIDEAVFKATRAMRAMDVAGAHRIAQDAIDIGMEHPFLFKVQGLWLHQTGRNADALRAFHHARSLDPDDPMILSGIAGALSAMGSHDAALTIVDTALAMSPNIVTTNFQRGWTLEALRDYPGAQAAYERTLTLMPQHLPALSGLATAAAHQQNHDLARKSAAAALALSPMDPTANFAMAMTEIAQGQPAAAEARLRGLLRNPLPPQPLAIAWGLLADALDAQDHTDEAFAAYSSENEALKAQHGSHALSDTRLVEELASLAANLKATSGGWQRSGAGGGGQLVFLLGFMRSGTTLLEQVLASHPKIATLEERDPLVEAARDYLGSAEGIERLMRANDDELAAVREAYWEAVRGHGIDPDSRVVVDKLPLNTAKLPLIARLFPDARILFAIRDPRDVVLSCFRRHFDIQTFTYAFLTLDGAARLYDATMAVGAWSRENLPLAFLPLRYEDLVADFEGKIRAVCDFIGVEWDDAMRDFARHASERAIDSQSASQVRRGLYSEGAGRWRAYAGKLQPVLPILEPWVRTFGYPDA